MENNNYYLKPKEILQECLFGVEWIEDLTRRESEEEVLSSDEETDEEFESSNKVKKRDGGLVMKSEGRIIEISSDEENDEEKVSFNKVKKEDGSLKMIDIISDESHEKVMKVSREDESISQESEKEARGLVSMSGNYVSKADLKDKVMIKSPPLLPFGWDKMKKEELLEKFIGQNQGKHIPEYLLVNLREADYDNKEKKSSVVKTEDKNKLKSKIKKEKVANKEIKKEMGNKSEDMEMLKKPGQFGFKRKVSVRKRGTTLDELGNVVEEKPRTDIYYFPPSGRKLRSLKEVEQYLSENQTEALSLRNFSFKQNKLDLGEDFEVVQQAGSREIQTIPKIEASRKKLPADTEKETPESGISLNISCKELDKETRILYRKGKPLRKMMRKFSEVAGLEGPDQLVFLCEGKRLRGTDCVDNLTSRKIEVKLAVRGK